MEFVVWQYKQYVTLNHFCSTFGDLQGSLNEVQQYHILLLFFCALVTQCVLQETTIITKQEHHLREVEHVNEFCGTTNFIWHYFIYFEQKMYCLDDIYFFLNFEKKFKIPMCCRICNKIHCFSFDISTYLKSIAVQALII